MGNATSHQQLPDNVPTELVAEIFNLACEDYKIHVRNAIDEIELVTKPTDAVVIYHGRREYIVNPGTISQVCRSWKDIAYNTPMLWDTVFVDMGHIGIMHPDVMAEVSTKLKMWLDRASKSPLTVKIEGADVVAKQLFEYADQWKRIDLYCLGNHPELYSELEGIMRRPPPLLETFICRPSFHCSLYGDEDAGPHPIFSISEASPKLTQIAKFRSFPVSISLSGINVCKWDRVGAFSILSNLQEMKSIKDCSIYSPGMRIIQPPLSPAIRLSLLENIALHSLLVSSYEYILPSLELPALRRLTFSNFKEKRVPSAGTMNPVKPIFLMLQRSGFPNVQYLDLNISASLIDAKELLDILRAVPALEHFKFALKPFTGIISSSVRMTKGAEPVVLNSLTSCHIDLSSLGNDRDGNSALFKYLTLPALKEFRVALPVRKKVKSDRTPQVADPAALDLLKRSHCLLTILQINSEINISETALSDLLKAMPTLECLHLVGQNYNRYSRNKVKFEIGNSFFELLLPQPRDSSVEAADTVCLPRLSELSLEGTLVADGDVLFSALDYRWKAEDQGMQRLSRFRLYTSGFIKLVNDSIHLRRRFQDLLMRGMDVVFQEPCRIEQEMKPIRY